MALEDIVQLRTKEGEKLLIFGPLAVTTELPVCSPDEIIAKWLDIARWSPTASNSQRLNWILVKDARKVAHLAGIVVDWLKGRDHYQELVEQWNKGHDPVLRRAPHLLIATVPEDYFWAMTDAATAISYLELTAYSLGLGTCWAGFFSRADAGRDGSVDPYAGHRADRGADQFRDRGHRRPHRSRADRVVGPGQGHGLGCCHAGLVTGDYRLDARAAGPAGFLTGWAYWELCL